MEEGCWGGGADRSKKGDEEEVTSPTKTLQLKGPVQVQNAKKGLLRELVDDKSAQAMNTHREEDAGKGKLSLQAVQTCPEEGGYWIRGRKVPRGSSRENPGSLGTSLLSMGRRSRNRRERGIVAFMNLDGGKESEQKTATCEGNTNVHDQVIDDVAGLLEHPARQTEDN